MAAGALVGVVADDRAVGHRVADAPVDARETRGDLVDGAVEVVDTPLERDGELDEVLAAAADQGALGVTQAPDAHPDVGRGQRDPAERDHDPGEGDGGGEVPGDVHLPLSPGAEKITLNCA